MADSSSFIIQASALEIRKNNQIIDQRDFPGFGTQSRANQTKNAASSQVSEQAASSSQKQPQTAAQQHTPILVPSQSNAITSGNNSTAQKSNQQPITQINPKDNVNQVKSADHSILELHDEYYPGDKQQIQSVPNKQTRVLPEQPKLRENQQQAPAVQNQQQQQQQSLLAQKKQQNQETQAIQQKSQQHPQQSDQKTQQQLSQSKTQPQQQQQQQSQQKAEPSQQQLLQQSQQKANTTQLQQKQAHPNQQLTNSRQTAEIHNQLIKQQNIFNLQQKGTEHERPLAQPARDHSNLNQSKQAQQQFDGFHMDKSKDNISSDKSKEAITKDVLIKYLPYFEAHGYYKNDQINDSDALKVLNTETVEFDQQVFSQLKEQLSQQNNYTVSEFLEVYASAIHILEEKKKKEMQVIQATKTKQTEILTRMEEAKQSEQPGQPSTLHIHVIQAFGLQIPSKYRVRVNYDDTKEVITNESISSADPIFDQSFKLDVTKNTSVLKLTVENASNGKIVGVVTQKIKQFSHQRKIEDEFILENEGGVLGDSSRKLFVGIQWVWSQTKLYETILTDNNYFDPLIRDNEEKLQDTMSLLDILHQPFDRDLQKLKSQLQNTQKTTKQITKKQEAKPASSAGWEKSLTYQTFRENAMFAFTVIAVLICFFKPNFIDVCLGFVVISKFFEESHQYFILICSLLGSIAVDAIQIPMIVTSWFQFVETSTLGIIIFSFLVFINTLVKIIFAVIFWKSRQEYKYNSLLYGYKELN